MSEQLQQHPSCEERVDSHLQGRLQNLRLMLEDCPECGEYPQMPSDTAGLVACPDCNGEGTTDQETDCGRCEGGGEIDCPTCLDRNERFPESLYEYGLGFDYVSAETFSGQDEPYFRYQLSWGGPGDEFRFFTGPDLRPHRIEYWFLDWFDGASRTLRGEDRDLLMQVWEWFNEAGVPAAEVERAAE